MNLRCCMLSTLLLVGLCMAGAELWAQQAEARKYSNDFLTIGVGARAFGMGNALGALSEDVSGAYWNPAALAHTGHAQSELGLMHASYFAGIATYNYGGFSLALDSLGHRRMAVSAIRIGVDDIPNTLALVEPDGSFNYNKLSSFSAADLAFLVSYAWQLRKAPRWSLGTNIKVIYRHAGNFANAWGFGIDLAAHYSHPTWKAGLVLRDATQTFNAWSFNTSTFEEAFLNTGNILPENSVEITRPSLRLALAHQLRINGRMHLWLAADTDVYTDGKRSSAVAQVGDFSFDPHLGIEWNYLNDRLQRLVSLRAGMYNLQNVKDLNGEDAFSLFPTVGLGLVIRQVEIDYALANLGNFSENLHSHIVSLNIHFQPERP